MRAAMTLRVSVAVTGIGRVYSVEAMFGGEPSRVKKQRSPRGQWMVTATGWS